MSLAGAARLAIENAPGRRLRGRRASHQPEVSKWYSVTSLTGWYPMDW